MGCNCGAKAGGARKVFVATFADGTTQSYSSEVEAAAAVARRGGKYKIK